MRLLFVGAGPAGLAPLIWAARNGVLAQMASEGIAIVERSADFGAGALSEHAIGSDTLAETFLECLADGAEPRLCALRNHKTALRLSEFAGGSAPLPIVAAFLSVLGRTMQEVLHAAGATLLTSHEAVNSRKLPDGKWCTRIVHAQGLTMDVVSERLILATGAEQRIEDIGLERIDGHALFPAISHKVMLSGEVLTHGGALRVAMRLAGRQDPTVAIIGGSHSALACANLLLGKDTGIVFAEGALSLLHRRPLRIYYPSAKDALADGYNDFTAEDLCPRTQRLYRLAGFRLEARELAKRLLGIGAAAAEPRLKLCTLASAGTHIDAWRILNEADLVIAAMGYRPRALGLVDCAGQSIPLAAHAARGAALVDSECRVLDQLQNPIPGVLALGLAAGFVPRGQKLGGEPSFTGQTNGLWLWQNDIGAIVVRNCRGERTRNPRRRASRLRVALLVGTRPEAIKLAPVILQMRASEGFDASVWSTGQHAQWAPTTLGYFGLSVDRLIETTETGHGLSRLGGTLLLGIQAAIVETQPDVIVVQGDTSSAFVGALAAGYAGVPVVHVEAGLRSGDRKTPFPEEAHRRAISQFATLHCAPTQAALNHLLSEGIEPQDIVLSGNTVIDALLHVRRTILPKRMVPETAHSQRPLLLMTCHRRESWGAAFVGICLAVREIGERGDCDLVFVLHPNPELADVAINMLSTTPGIHLVAPLGYPDFVQLLTQAALILTDSGGIQEEATALGTPLLILRENTERPECLLTGNAQIIGNKQQNIVAAVSALLQDPQALLARRAPSNVYGDGRAAQRIVEAITARWKGSDRRTNISYISATADSKALKQPSLI